MAADLPQHWNGLPRLAGQMAECLRCAREDKKLSDADRDKAGKQYGRGTLSVLRRAIAGGYKDATALQAMPELAPLRDSPEFKDEFSKLISSMSSK
jgi:hypothetical protein